MPARTARLSSATAIMRAAVGGGRRATGRTLDRVGIAMSGAGARRGAAAQRTLNSMGPASSDRDSNARGARAILTARVKGLRSEVRMGASISRAGRRMAR